MVGQAWHWFDHEQALAQVRRVVRPGGVLSGLGRKFVGASLGWGSGARVVS